MTYPKAERNSARSEASRLLAKPNINKAIEERLKRNEWFKSITEDDIIKMSAEVYEKANPSGKIRLLELYAKAKGLTKDNQPTQTIAIFEDRIKSLNSRLSDTQRRREIANNQDKK